MEASAEDPTNKAKALPQDSVQQCLQREVSSLGGLFEEEMEETRTDLSDDSQEPHQAKNATTMDTENSSSSSVVALASTAQHPQQHCHQQQHRDGNREIRAMIIAALPFPPMPIMVCRELAGECRWVFG